MQPACQMTEMIESSLIRNPKTPELWRRQNRRPPASPIASTFRMTASGRSGEFFLANVVRPAIKVVVAIQFTQLPARRMVRVGPRGPLCHKIW